MEKAASGSREHSSALTFLFTDIEGSTKLQQELGFGFEEVIHHHNDIIRKSFVHRGGLEQTTEGDSFFFVFDSPQAAVSAATAAQLALLAHEWPSEAPVRVRMGMHSGVAQRTAEGYIGLNVSKAARIRDAAHGGQILLSRASVCGELPERVSLRNLGIHRLKDLAEAEPLYQLIHPELPEVFPPLRALDIVPNNLPVQRSSFIGRKHSIAEISELLRHSALVTLTGPGGSGKTRLALQVAPELLDRYPDGLHFVDLSSLSDPALVVQTAAAALGVPERAGQSQLETLMEHLSRARLLLILDNCEHVLGATAELVSRLLGSSPRLQILATSREPLKISGERIFAVGTLTVPEAGDQVTRADVLSCEAARLLAERAESVRGSFVITDKNAPAVAAICRRLDGVPLAIELAAARLRALSPEQLATRLADRFDILGSGDRASLPRQQTLKALIDWSHDLLRDEERALFRRLSVFAGSFSLEDAEIVCSQESVGVGDVLNLLAALVDKSLVYADPAGDVMRYRMLETIREYARSRLLEANESDALLTEHFNRFLRLAEEWNSDLAGPRQVYALGAFALNNDNFRAALGWGLRHSLDEFLMLANSMARFWLWRGHLEEGLWWLSRGLDMRTTNDDIRLEALLNAANFMAFFRGLAPAIELGNAALSLAESLDSQWGRASALHLLGRFDELAGSSAGLPRLEDAARLFQELGDDWNRAYALRSLAAALLQRQEFEQARQLGNEALEIWGDLGDRRCQGLAREVLGMISLEQHDYAAARDHLLNGIVDFIELEDETSVSKLRIRLAAAQRCLGKLDLAIDELREAFRLVQRLHLREEEPSCLLELAALEEAKANYSRAAQLWGSAERALEALGLTLSTDTSHVSNELETVLRKQLGDAAFEEKRVEGRRMDPFSEPLEAVVV